MMIPIGSCGACLGVAFIYERCGEDRARSVAL
jgi:hypothetical protein